MLQGRKNRKEARRRRAQERAIKSYTEMSVEELQARIEIVCNRRGSSHKELGKLLVEMQKRVDQ